MKYFLLLLLPVSLIVSCSSSNKTAGAREDAVFNKWLHHTKSELVRAWGMPDSTRPDGKKGEILVYKEGVDYKSVMNQKYTGPQYSFRKEMYVNADSLIYYWRAWRKK